MAESLLLPLREDGSTRAESSDLAARLRQIDLQKGAFRHVTERSLLDEIQKAEAGIQEAEIGGDSEKENEEDLEETIESYQEKVWKAREEMLKQLE